jgi:hypothetical protein
MKTLTLIKSSVVETDRSHPYQCKGEGHRAYEYEIEITTTDTLDKFGFIIDHSVVHNKIKEVVNTRISSCENIVISIEEAIYLLLTGHGAEVLEMMIVIKPVGSNAYVKRVARYPLFYSPLKDFEDIHYPPRKRVRIKFKKL